jgi:integrase
VRKAFNLASQVLDRAVVLRKLPANPARVPDAVSLPTVQSSEMRFLAVAELDALADATDPRYAPLIVCGAYTGLRWGELAGLKAKYVDLDTGRLTVTEVLYEVGGRLGFKDPKTQAARRTITLPRVVREVLGEYMAAYPVVGDGLIFTDTAGGPLRRSNFAWLVANGEHPKTIQARLGHASIKTTLDRYGHLMPGLDEGAAHRLDELSAGREKHSGSTHRASAVSNLPSAVAEN